MKRKRHLATGKVKKYKAPLNVDGLRQHKGRDYDATYAPVASWPAIHLLLILSSVYNWHTTQLDFVLAYPQTPAERQMFMHIPKGITLEGGDPSDHVLEIKHNVYGQKQAGRVWNQHLVRKLQSIGFAQSKINQCVFYKGRIIYVLYTDDSVLAGPCKRKFRQYHQANPGRRTQGHHRRLCQRIPWSQDNKEQRQKHHHVPIALN